MKVKMIDLTQPLSIHTPPWPSYIPLQVQYFKRIAGAHMGQGANGQVITTSMHVGTHIDGIKHFYGHGPTIGEQPLEDFCGEGVVVDISKDVSDYSLYTPDMFTAKAEIRKGDILIINTGYHRYAFDQKECDEVRYFVKHPGPDKDFVKWCHKMKFKWIGVDCGSADHPMNTILRQWHPRCFQEAEEKLKKTRGKAWDDYFPYEDFYQVMHLDMFPRGIIHAENLGGDIDRLNNKRTWIGLFPWKAMDLESCICRVAAFEFGK